VVFVASSGDDGAAPGVQWPASSPNVLSVGGTSLTISAQNAWVGESAWSGSGGGYSKFESKPSFQNSAQGSSKRSVPDVAYDANPSTGFYVYDSFPNSSNEAGWFAYGGTSAGAPQWAALIALADQGRGWRGLAPLPTGAAALYSLSPADFHDITTGSNGYSAVSGYDLATGRGSPRADLVIADLVTYVAPSPNVKTATTTKSPSTTGTTPHIVAAGQTAPAAARELRANRAIAEMLLEMHTPPRPDDDFGAWPTI
jgi:subtilase family serine protease